MLTILSITGVVYLIDILFLKKKDTEKKYRRNHPILLGMRQICVALKLLQRSKESTTIRMRQRKRERAKRKQKLEEKNIKLQMSP